MGETLALAAGKWSGILKEFGVEESVLNRKHQPCPLCGGTDRFRYTDKYGDGNYICGQCGPGTGFRLLCGITGLDNKTLLNQIDGVLGVVKTEEQKPKQDPKIYLNRIRTELTSEMPDVVDYLEGRGIQVLPELAVKQHNAIKHRLDDGSTAYYKALCALFTAADGNPSTYQMLCLENGNKAHTKTLPVARPMAGGAIRLFPVAEYLGVAEGIETALSVMQLYGVPCWATTSASVLESFVVPEGVKRLGIFADNDLNFTGQAAAYKLANRIKTDKRTKDLKVNMLIPANPGEDFNDVLIKGASI